MKSEQLKNLKRKNIARHKQLATLLVRNEDFQKRINKFRKSWGIPDSGFENVEQWQKNEKRLNKEFKAVSQKMADGKFKIVHRLYEGMVTDNIFNSRSLLNEFAWRTAVHKFLRAYLLMDNMSDFVKYYIVFNDFPPDKYFLSLPYINSGTDPISGEFVNLIINIDERTTLEEIKAVWKGIMKEQAMMSSLNYIYGKDEILNDDESVMDNKRKPQSRILRNFERDEHIVQLKRQGLTGTEIVAYMRKNGFKTVSYDYVPKLISRYKKRIEGRKAKN